MTRIKHFESNTKTTFERTPFYMGVYKDTILVGRYHRDLRIPISEHFIKINSKSDKQYPWSPDSSIIFNFNDTVNTILEIYDYKKESYVQYYGRTLIIQNTIDSTIRIGYGYDVPILVEAQTKEGVWQTIETRYMYDCGVGLHYIVLGPKEIACLIIPEYQGNFETLLRFKLGNNYSKPFIGRINENQLNN